jgi:adenine-specific DNA-methyltransferase
MMNVPDSCKVYTPARLAAAMINAISSPNYRKWLEPSFGEGVFLLELQKAGISRNDVVALEIETRPGPADKLARAVRGVNSLRWLPQSADKFDAIVGNPPYVALSAVSSDVRKSALALTLPGVTSSLSRNANLWIAFTYACISSLERHGSLSLVLPAAFEYADYAAALREHLPKLFGKVKVIRAKRSLFPDVQEGCVVLVAKDYGAKNVSFARVLCDGLEDVCRELVSGELLGNVQSETIESVQDGEIFGSLAAIRLGGVSGDSDYFVFNDAKRLKLGLPSEACVPVLTKSRHLSVPEVTKRHWDDLRQKGEPIWLFRPRDEHLRNRNVRAYLRHGEQGGCNIEGQKIRNRTPWYETPLPKRAHVFISGHVSGGLCFSYNRSANISITNTLYAARFGGELAEQKRYEIGAALFCESVRRQIFAGSRIYSSGLVKVEPGDIARLRIPTASRRADFRSLYRKLFFANDSERELAVSRVFA